jgi:hypothetical protein
MTKKIILMLSALAAAVSFAGYSWADDDPPEYECCCVLTCKWEYTIWNAACQNKDNATGTVYTVFAACDDVPGSAAGMCESQNLADGTCLYDTASDAKDIVKYKFDTICPEALLGPVITMKYIPPTPVPCVFGIKDDCSIIDFYNPSDPQLTILRRFRDEMLSTSITGRKLIELYYEYSGILVEIYDEYPDIKALAKKLLEKAVPVIEAFLDSGGKSELITDGVSSDVADLIDEINAVMASPLKETLLGMRKDVMDGALLE